jgi:Xaa-Pro aminopeptidase
MVTGMNEVTKKLSLLRSLAHGHGVDALLLQRVSSLAWATDGAAAYVNTASSNGEASLLVTPDRQILFTNNIEAPRLEKDEGLISQGWDFRVAPWFETNAAVWELTHSLKLGTDALFPDALDLSGEIARLRTDLTAAEGGRFRSLGKLCAQAMDCAARNVHPGQTEFEIAALLMAETQKRGVQPIVCLIATDERIFNFRHPLPTAKKLDRYAMLILCGRQRGLVCSITRLVHFGAIPEEIQRKALAVAQVDAAMIAATRPGQSLGKIFLQIEEEYARVGYPGEWRLHHQGGPAAYEPREYVATPDSTEIVKPGQAYAWNPSITGTKSEDTILVGESGNEVLTEIPGWPMIKMVGSSLERPAILEID